MRDNTERPVTIEQGTNQLAGTDPARVLQLARRVLAQACCKYRMPEKWDGKAAQRVLDTLEQLLA
jgi:UDP-N-acetylglucosamine 2-epimerase (non-hydrolysing)